MKELVDKLVPYFEKYKDVDGLEIEFRLGYIEKSGFSPNLSDTYFNKVINILNESSSFRKISSKQTDTYYEVDGETIRKSDETGKCTIKKRLCNIDIRYEPFDVRVSFSKEESTEFADEENTEELFTRTKERDSFLYKYWSYDLTTVTNGNKKTHEIELEIKDTKKSEIEYLVESSLLKIQDISRMCESGNEDYSFSIVKETCYDD